MSKCPPKQNTCVKEKFSAARTAPARPSLQGSTRWCWPPDAGRGVGGDVFAEKGRLNRVDRQTAGREAEGCRPAH